LGAIVKVDNYIFTVSIIPAGRAYLKPAHPGTAHTKVPFGAAILPRDLHEVLWEIYPDTSRNGQIYPSPIVPVGVAFGVTVGVELAQDFDLS